MGDSGLTINVIWQSGTLLAMIASIVWLVLTGRLVTRSQVKDLVQDRDHWKTAYWRTQDNNDAQTEQIRRLMEALDTTNKVLKALPPPMLPEEAKHVEA